MNTVFLARVVHRRQLRLRPGRGPQPGLLVQLVRKSRQPRRDHSALRNRGRASSSPGCNRRVDDRNPETRAARDGADSPWVARINPRQAGEASLEYASFLVSGTVETAAVDSQGRIHFAGYPYFGVGLEFAPTANAFRPECLTRQSGQCWERYYAFLDPTRPGSAGLRYASYTGFGNTWSLLLDPDERPWLIGTTTDPAFPHTATGLGGECRVDQPNCERLPDEDVYVLGLDPDAAGADSLRYGVRLGGDDGEGPSIAAFAPDGSLFVAGGTVSPDFPTTANAIQRPCPDPIYGPCPDQDAFLVQLDTRRPGAEALRYGTLFGGSAREFNYPPTWLSVGADGTVLVAGGSESEDFPITPGAADGEQYRRQFRWTRNFLARIDPGVPGPEGLLFATYWGGWEEVTTTVEPAAGGLVLAVAATRSPGSATTPSTFDRTCGFGQVSEIGQCVANAYIALLDPTDGPRSEILTEPIELSYRVPDPYPLERPVELSGDPGPQFRTLAETDDGWLSVSAAEIGANSSFTAVADPGSLYFQYHHPNDGAYSGRVRVISDDPVIRRDLRVTLQMEKPAPPRALAVVNAASFEDRPIAPGQLVSIFGTQLGPVGGVGGKLDEPYNRDRLARDGAGVAVHFNNNPAPLTFLRHDQINAVVPYEIAGERTVNMRIFNPGGESEGFDVGAADSSPALFTANSSGSGPAAALNQDYSFNSSENPVDRGGIILLYGTGEGQTDPSGVTGQLTTGIRKPVLPVSAEIGGQTAEVLFAGAAPGFTGLLQMNVRVPQSIAPGAAEVRIRIGEAAGPPGVTIAVR